PVHHPPRPARAQHRRSVRPRRPLGRRRAAGPDGGQLRALGRLGYPMRRRRGERGFRRVSWDEALGVLAGALAATDPDRVALYLTSRGITNEVYYVAAKAARALGIASIYSAARVCHAPSTLGLRETVGVAATT